jgi:hypothetical protein
MDDFIGGIGGGSPKLTWVSRSRRIDPLKK